MKIMIWSDFVCPFCIIGQSHLDQALQTFEHADKVEIEYKSFVLMPDAEYVPEQGYAETFAQLKGLPLEQAKEMLANVVDMAKEAGVEINYHTAKLANTYDAHRIFQYAKEQGKGNDFFRRFYTAHFSEGEILSNLETLIRLSAEIGLDGFTVRRIIENSQNTDKVNRDIEESRTVGVQGVPFFVIDNKYALSGAQPVKVFKQTLHQIWEKEY